MTVKSYQELIAWQRAMDLVVSIYKLSAKFPREELYGLTNQLRRSSVSVPSNIAEGQGRGGTADFVRFLGIANGSLQEAETQMLIGQRLGFISGDELKPVMDLSAETGRVLNGLMRSLQ